MWVLSAPFDDGYDNCGPKATRDEKESARTRVPLFRCFIDLQKAYDSVDRTPMAGARSLRNTAADDRGDPPIL